MVELQNGTCEDCGHWSEQLRWTQKYGWICSLCEDRHNEDKFLQEVAQTKGGKEKCKF